MPYIMYVGSAGEGWKLAIGVVSAFSSCVAHQECSQSHLLLSSYRVGSQFQLRVGVSLNGLDDIVAKGNLANDSLVFRTSKRTAFFLGGWPEGAQVVVSTS